MIVNTKLNIGDKTTSTTVKGFCDPRQIITRTGLQMKKQNCPKFENCSAALCPLDPHPRRYWYADTEICRSKTTPKWVKIQRKIQKLNPDPHHYFTQLMLESITRVAKDITGIENVGYNPTKEYVSTPILFCRFSPV